jgi:hypothetical protein
VTPSRLAGNVTGHHVGLREKELFIDFFSWKNFNVIG